MAWYVTLSTNPRDRSQKASHPPVVGQGRWGLDPGPVRVEALCHDGQQVALWPRFNKDSGKVERRGESRKKN